LVVQVFLYLAIYLSFG